jgi:hypothetical protein
VPVFRLLLLISLLGTVAWCVLVGPNRDPEPDAAPPPSLTAPMRDSLDQGVRDTVDRAKDRAAHGFKKTGHRLEEAGSEAHEWLSDQTDELAKKF